MWCEENVPISMELQMESQNNKKKMIKAGLKCSCMAINAIKQKNKTNRKD